MWPLGDIDLVGEFVDKASADDLRGRREWRRLLELAQARRVDLIVVWRLDRAFRSVLDGAPSGLDVLTLSTTAAGKGSVMCPADHPYLVGGFAIDDTAAAPAVFIPTLPPPPPPPAPPARANGVFAQLAPGSNPNDVLPATSRLGTTSAIPNSLWSSGFDAAERPAKRSAKFRDAGAVAGYR